MVFKLCDVGKPELVFELVPLLPVDGGLGVTGVELTMILLYAKMLSPSVLAGKGIPGSSAASAAAASSGESWIELDFVKNDRGCEPPPEDI
jgi:hypothetical protein